MKQVVHFILLVLWSSFCMSTHLLFAFPVSENFMNPAANFADAAPTTDATSCIYRIECHDTFGDGWNGGSVSIIQNGNEVFQGGLINGNYGVYFFELQSDVPIEIYWHPGGWAYEVFFDIVTPDDQILFSAPDPEESLLEWSPDVEDVLLATVTPYCPDCYAVAAIELHSLTATSAHLTWFSVFEQFHVEYGFAGFTQGTGTFETIYGEKSVMLTDLVPSTAYDFYVQSLCNNGAWSDWKKLSFTTLQTPATIPYSHGFEDATENGKWALLNGTQTNKWYIGSTVAQAGSNALFISNTGNTHTYTNNATSYTIAHRLFHIPDMGVFNVTFNWMNYGEANYDIVRAFFVPNDISLAAGGSFGMPTNVNTVPNRWIEISGVLFGYSSWQNFTGKAAVSDAGDYNLVFFWKNDASGGSQPPAAIDNIEITPAQWISGTYTIDKTLPTADRNFNSFAEAVTVLNECGILDTLTFLIPDGQIHNITLTNNNGLQITSVGAATRPVFFRKAGTGANPLLKVTGTSNTADACFTVDNSHYITFDGLDIENAGTSSANYLERGFCLTNSSTNIKILNGTINLKNASTSYGIHIPNVTSGTSPTNQVQQFYSDNMTIKRATYGYYFSSSITTRAVTVSRARIDSVTTGIIGSGSNLANCIIKDSKITNATTGISLVSADAYMQIYNNVIRATETGIYINTYSATDIYYLAHNTIYIPPTTSSAYGVRKYSTNGRVALTNNIIINKSTNTNSTVLNIATTDNSSIMQGSNNNIYYSEAGSIYQSSSVTINNVKGYINLLGDGRESNSIQKEVSFISTTAPFNFNINPGVPTKVESGGQTVSWVTADIDGNPRFGAAGYTGTGTAPDIGAYEFEGIRDTIIQLPLHGIYTIDNTRPTEERNFNSFPEAIEALSTCNISDTTIFETIPGQVHNMTFTNIYGLRITSVGAADKPIIFRKAGAGANPLLKVTGTSNNADACFYVEDSHYITFDGLDIETAETSNANKLERAFCLTNSSSNIQILNGNINLKNVSESYGIYIPNVSGNQIQQFYSDNMTLKGAYYGYAFDSNIANKYITISRAQIDSAGIGISGSNLANCIIKDSKITNANTGIYLGVADNNMRIYNNVIHAKTSGININSSSENDVYYLAHNTIYILPSTNQTYGLRKYSTNGRIALYNNIIINKSTYSNSYAFYNASTDNSNILQGSNNNIYYCEACAVYANSSSVIKNNIKGYMDLLGDGRESNSFQTEVPFISTTEPFNFNIQQSVPTKAESGGQTVSWVAVDFNGNPRFGATAYSGTGTAPDIGAYEFEGVIDTTVSVRMQGIYTIDNTRPTGNRNFNSFSEAIAALNTNYISDTTIFETVPGQVHNITFTTAQGLRIEAGGAPQRELIFRKSNSEAANTVLKINGTSGTSDACFYVDAANYITFNGLDILNAGTTTSNYLEQAFYFTNAKHIKILNCNIRLRNQSGNYGIRTTYTTKSIYSENVSIKNAYYAYYLNGGGTNIIDRTFVDSVTYGIYNSNSNQDQDQYILKNSKIYNTSNYPIYLSAGKNQQIYNNVVHTVADGIYIYGSGGETDTIYCAHNTIYVHSTNNTVYCLRRYTTNGKIALYNNIFINKSPNVNSRCFFNYGTDHSAILQGTNNNVYFCEYGGIFQDGSVTKYTINEYRELLGDEREKNSIQTDVPFISTTYPINFDIDPTSSTKVESGGKSLSWVQTDINGAPRFGAAGYTGTGIAPDIGAYEFEGIPDSTVVVALSGVYTINNMLPTAGRNFNTFDEAFTTLNDRGISNAVTFEIAAGQVHNITLTNSLGLRIAALGDIEKPIIFQKSGSGANPLLKITATSGTTDACFYLENAHYITFDGLDIENAGTAAANYLERGFYLNNTTNITVHNCSVRLQNHSSSNYSGIYIDGNTDHLLFSNNTLKRAYHGYYRSYGSSYNTNHTIINNVIDSVAYGIIYGSGNISNSTIKENKITNATSLGISLPSGNNNRIYNNVIYLISSGSGIQWNSTMTDTLYVAHNTIYIQSTDYYYPSYCFYKNVSNVNGNLGLYNNIFINKSASTSSACLYSSSSTINSKQSILAGSNNNIYYCPQGFIFSDYNNKIDIKNINEYIEYLGDGRESNSCATDLPFVSTTHPLNFDILLSVATKAESGGQLLPWITTDINGAPRYGAPTYTGAGAAPDIGAYEFEGIRDIVETGKMYGTYTIDHTQPTEARNFNTFEDALEALSNRGISDTIIFETVPEQIHNITLTTENGLVIKPSGTVDKPIIFRKSNPNSGNTVLRVTGTSSSSDVCFYLNNINSLIFDGLTIENAGTANSNYLEQAFYLNNSNHITIQNCTIRLQNASTSRGIYVYNNVSNLLCSNITVKRAYYGLYLPSNVNNFTLTQSVIDSVSYGIYGTSGNFTGNKITNCSSYGIDLRAGNNQHIYNNLFHCTAGRAISFTLNATDTVYVAHNTIYMAPTTGVTYCITSAGENGKIALSNNIFINKSTSTSSYCVSMSSNKFLQSSNNNIYYCQAGPIYNFSSNVFYLVNHYMDFLGGGRESNSYQTDVPFISTTYPFNFGIQPASPTKAESAGQVLPEVTTDINGAPRYGTAGYAGTGTAPDIGAYEFEGVFDSTDLSHLHGIYTIDNSLPTEDRNFNTFQEAIATLNSRAVSDTVIFETVPGQYHDITLTNANGLYFTVGGAANKPVIFRKSNNGVGNTLLKVTGTSGSDACFYVDGANYITFEDLDIENIGISSANYLEMAFRLNNASHITLRNCNIRLRYANSNTGIYASGTVTGFLSENVAIKHASNGYDFSGSSNSGNTICRSIIDSVNSTGINYSGSSLTVRETKITNVVTGISLLSGRNHYLINNVIHASSTGINLNYSGATDTVFLANNTVYMTPSGYATYSLRKSYDNGRIGLYNNIFINKSTNTGSRCFMNNNNANNNFILPNSNNNIYYCEWGAIYQNASTSIYSVNEYMKLLGDGRENHSYQTEPPFFSLEELNFYIKIDHPTKAESGGQPLPWVLTDMDGTPRNPLTPDIGAYEFNGTEDNSDHTPLSGVYSIDNIMPTRDRNFNTFKEAIDALNSRYISDTVIFETIPGQLHEITLNSNMGQRITAGGTAKTPVIFRKYDANAPNTILKVKGTNSDSDACFYLESVNYITFDGLTIENAGTNNNSFLEQGIFLTNTSNITIRNCTVQLKNNNLYGTNSGSGIYSNNTLNYLLAENNTIKNVQYGYYFWAGGGTGNTISNATIDSVNTAINFSNISLNNMTIRDSKITNATTGIVLVNGNNQRIYNNVMHVTGTGIDWSSNNANDTIYLAHNTVYIPATTATVYGLRFRNAGKMGLYNNIIIQKSTNNNAYNFYCDGNPINNILQSSNNNIYFRSAGYLFRNNVVSLRTIDEYRTLLGDDRESASVEEDVPFINTLYPFIFDVQKNIPTQAESGGQALAWITTDIAGNPRYGADNYGGSGSAPDIGAYEFEGRGKLAQTICTGDSTELVDFTFFYPETNVAWQISKYPHYTTGYLTSGSNILPKMKLINPSNQLDTIIYTVTPETDVATTYMVRIRPYMQMGNFSDNMFPADSAAMNFLSIPFSWQAVTGATFYDLYVWHENEQCPAQPNKVNLQTMQHTLSGMFAYGNKYHWKVVARNFCSQIESDVRMFEIRKLPDLHVSEVHISAAYAGQKATIVWTVVNDGEGPTIEPLWYDRIWFHSFLLAGTDGFNQTQPVFLATVPNLHGLGVGESYTNSIEITLPDRMAGTYFILLSTDMNQIQGIDWTPTGLPSPPIPYTPSITGVPYPYLFANCGYPNVQEPGINVNGWGGKYDNFFYIAFDMYPAPLPDLVVTAASHPAAVFSGQPVEITYQVKNQGALDAQGSWIDAIYISPDMGLNTSIISTKNVPRTNVILEKDSSYTNKVTLDIPPYISGDYYVMINPNATKTLYEGVFGANNLYLSPTMLNVFLTPPPDLTPTQITAPTIANVREKYNFTYTVSNIGANPTPESFWKDRIYLSPTPVFNSQTAVPVTDVLHYGVLDMDNSYTQTVNLTIPDVPAGEWYFVVHTDCQNFIFEYNGKGNNIVVCNYSTQITTPDLSVSDVQVTTHPLILGDMATLSWKVTNVGTGRVNSVNVTDKLFISTSITYNPILMIYLDSISYPNTLNPGESITHTKNVKLPCLNPGNYYLYAVADAPQRLYEQGKLDNNRARTTVQNLLLPDFIVTDLTVPTTGNSGKPITLNYTLKNDHNGAVNQKNVNTKFYISTESTFNIATVTAIGEQNTMLNLAPGASQTLQAVFNLPHGIAGVFYLYAFVNENEAVCEVYSDNNVKRSAAITVTLTPWPDFAVTRVEHLNTIEAGATISLEYEVQNNGIANVVEGTWSDKIYITHKTFLDNTATQLATLNKTGNLAINESYTETVTLQISPLLSGGEYYLIVYTDAGDLYYEHLAEENNIWISPVLVQAYPLDLAVVSVQAPETMPWGATISVQMQIQNISEKKTLIDTWFDGFYLASDSVFTPAAILLKEQKHVGHILPDGNYTVTLNCVIPNGMQGNYYLLAVADYKGINYDINRANNMMGKKITITAQTFPDLTVEHFEVLEAEPISGQPFKATYTIKNMGTRDIVNQNWNDRIFLSTSSDAPLAGDLILSNPLKKIGLPIGASYTDTVTLTVPIPKDGNFVLWLKANANNSIYEHTALQNNLASAMISVILPPPGDLLPANIQSEEFEVTAGEYLHVSYDIYNMGDVPVTGNNLRDLIYLSPDPSFSINSKLLGQVTAPIDLPPYSYESRNFTARISGIKEGEYYILVKTDALNAFNETDKTNNTAASIYPIQVHMRELPVNTPIPDTLFNNLTQDYKLSTDTIIGETVLVYLHSADLLKTTLNNIYIKHNDVADNVFHDFSSDGQFTANPEVYIPFTQPEFYGVNLKGNTQAGNSQDIVIQADILPFEIRSINPTYGGNTGRVTVELLGSKFTPGMEVWLEKDTFLIDADTLIYVDLHKAYAVFNLQGQPLGTYTLGIYGGCYGDDYLVDGFEIVNGIKDGLLVNMVMPNTPVWYRVVAVTFEYVNAGNVDIVNTVMDVKSVTLSTVGLEQGTVKESTEKVLPFLLDSPGEPPGILRPGRYGMKTFYCYLKGNLGFIIEKNNND